MNGGDQAVGAGERETAGPSLLHDVVLLWLLVPLATFVVGGVVLVGAFSIGITVAAAIWVVTNFAISYKLCRRNGRRPGRVLFLALGSALAPPAVYLAVISTALAVGCSGGGCSY